MTSRSSVRLAIGRCLAVSFVLGIGATVAPIRPLEGALAECGFPNRWPSFAVVAPRSDTVVTGTVTKIVDYWRHEIPGTFVLKVDDVLKGDADARIRLSNVYTTGGCVVSWLVVRRGDRIAVAIDGVSNVNGPVSAVAYLSPLPRDRDRDMRWAGMRQLTIAQVRVAVGLPATDTVSADHNATRQPSAAVLTGIVRAAVNLVMEVIGRLRTSP